MMDINSEICSLLQKSSGLLSISDVDRLMDLKIKKDKYLEHEVLTLKLKSRAMWICEGDANTKIFHSFASAIRNSKTIWSLKDCEGNLVRNDTALKLLGQ